MHCGQALDQHLLWATDSTFPSPKALHPRSSHFSYCTALSPEPQTWNPRSPVSTQTPSQDWELPIANWRNKAILSLFLKTPEADNVVLPFPIPSSRKMGQWDNTSPSCLCKDLKQDLQRESCFSLLPNTQRLNLFCPLLSGPLSSLHL